MKAILEFDLDAAADRIRHNEAIAAPDMVFVLHEYREWLRAVAKHGNAVTVTECYEMFLSYINDNNLSDVVDSVA